MSELDPHMARVLAKLAESAERPYPEIGVKAARVISAERTREYNRDSRAVTLVEDGVFDGPHGRRAFRTYDNDPSVSQKPGVLYLHGGGWVLGSLDSHDNVCREIAARTGHRVVSLDYALAPEFPFPAAIEDSVGLFDWLYRQGPTVGIDPDRIAVAGDSAGANLAVNVCLTCRDRGGPAPRAAALIYGVFNADGASNSHQDYGGGGYVLSSDMMAWFFDQYVPDQSQRDDPRVCLNRAILQGLPPLYISIAEFDPLRDEGEQFCRAAQAAGVTIQRSLWPGVTHGCIQMGSMIPRVDGFFEEISVFLKKHQHR